MNDNSPIISKIVAGVAMCLIVGMLLLWAAI